MVHRRANHRAAKVIRQRLGAFWEKKRKANQKRDRLVNRTLATKGWRVLRVWEHALRKKDRAALVRRLRQVLG